MTTFAEVLVVLCGVWLVGLAAAMIVVPARAERFLGRFASSARAHYTEQVLRLIAGGAVVVFAPQMRFPELFRIFGWLLVVTAIALLLVPWRWHRRFGEWVIPLAQRHLGALAVAALALGAFILFSAL